jgi:hypothetical protein
LTYCLSEVLSENQEFNIDIRWNDGHLTHLQLSQLDLIYMWQQFMAVCDDNINDPKVLLFSVNAHVEFITFFKARQNRKKNLLFCSSKSILRVYGRFLFNIAYLDAPG